MSPDPALLDIVNTSLTLLLFAIGLGCLLTRRNVIKQVIGLKIMLQGVTIGLIPAGRVVGDPHTAQTMVISALIIETVVIAIAISLIVNIFLRHREGDIDDLVELKG
ncbi:MAG: NADH-quinone oxidoreductase subunit K [Anaerolineae bacterium]|nr:NADH-quinone oxidoreductase subunit K [Anaerolineae bacterium]